MFFFIQGTSRNRTKNFKFQKCTFFFKERKVEVDYDQEH